MVAWFIDGCAGYRFSDFICFVGFFYLFFLSVPISHNSLTGSSVGIGIGVSLSYSVGIFCPTGLS